MLNGKTLLSRLQTEFHKEVSADFGLERGEIREDGARKEHLDSLDYKKQQREIEIEQRESQIEKQEEIIEVKKAEIKEAEVIKEELETEIGKLDAIRELVKPLPFSVSQLFHSIGDALKTATDILFSKIERMETIFSSDLRAAFCKMLDIGKRLFTPATIGGLELYSHGRKPLYQGNPDGYYQPIAIEDSNGNIRTNIDRNDWRQTFPRYERPDYNPIQDQKQDIIERITTIRDIACGKPEAIDELEQDDEIEVCYVDGRFIPINQKPDSFDQDIYDRSDNEHLVAHHADKPDTAEKTHDSSETICDQFNDTAIHETDLDTDPFDIDGNDDDDEDYADDVGFD